MCKYYLCYNIYTSLSPTPCLTLRICLAHMSANLPDSGYKKANAVLWLLAKALRVLPFTIQHTCNEKSSHITLYNNDIRIFQTVQLPRSVSPLIAAATIQGFPTHKGQTTTEQITVQHRLSWNVLSLFLMQQTKGMPGYAYVLYVDDTSWKNNSSDI
jgi:hypothetical protein